MKVYVGLKAVELPFSNENDIVTTSSSCFQIVANTVEVGNQVCSNATDTTSHMWYGDNPYGD